MLRAHRAAAHRQAARRTRRAGALRPRTRRLDLQRRRGYALRIAGLWFSAPQLQALLAAHQWLAEVEPGLLGEEIAPLVKRLEALLEQRQPGGGHIHHKIKLIALAARKVEDTVFRAVAGALADSRQLDFAYRGRNRMESTQRTVSPLRLTWYKSNWYLDAWCHLRDGLRSFSLDRIATPRRLDAAARSVDAAIQTAHYASAYGIFSGAARHTAVLRFTPLAARWVADERWHAAQSGHFLIDGSYELAVPYGNPTELVMDILKYGPEVEVVAPNDLRDLVRRRLSESLARYE